MAIKCSYCKGAAVYIDLDKKRYCKKHFVKYYESKVKKTIKRFKLFKKNDKIAVACSGGKDSTTALYLISKWYKNVEAIAIDEGIKGYRSNTLVDLKKFCKENDIKLNIYSFKKDFGFDLDKLSKRKNLCRFCGVLRRYMLNHKSKGFDKVVTGHNLDDEAQSIFMNILKSNKESFVRLGPISGIVHDPKFVPRVKPLYLCTEKETFIYSRIKGFDVRYIECPYASSSFRGVVRDMLNKHEMDDPGSKKRLVENFLDMLPKIRKDSDKTITGSYCTSCGEPTLSNLCHACSIVKEVVKKK